MLARSHREGHSKGAAARCCTLGGRCFKGSSRSGLYMTALLGTAFVPLIAGGRGHIQGDGGSRRERFQRKDLEANTGSVSPVTWLDYRQHSHS